MLFNHVCQWLRQKGIWVVIVAVCASVLPAKALAADNDFTIQVSPSPLVVSLAPGKEQTTFLTVRNLSNHSETLYPKLNGFTIDKSSKNIRLLESAPTGGVEQWASFKAPSVTIPAGGSQTVGVVFNTPQNVGFSYSLAITLSRKQDNVIQGDGVHLRGAVAVFCLINIDRPDAKRQLSIESFASKRSTYQYAPVDFALTIKNEGNIIDQPKGTVFIQRSFDSSKPLATIPVNPGNNYILPGTSREFAASWKTGFPVYVTNEQGKRHLKWDWKHLSDLRFGKYVAKAVLVYNDGQHDVPLVSSYTFWVIPWTLLLVLLLLVTVLGMGLFGWGRVILKGTKKVRGYAHRR